MGAGDSYQKKVHMDERSVLPGPDSDAVFNCVHEWVTLRGNRRRDRTIRLDWLDLVDTACRERNLSTKSVSDAMTSLVDLGWVEKVEHGFRVLQNFSPEVTASGGTAPPERAKLPRSGGLARTRSGASAASGAPLPTEASEASRRGSDTYAQKYVWPGPPPRYPNNPRVRFARDIFPSMCREAGIAVHPMQFSWTKLARTISTWEIEFGVDLKFITQMAVEFVHQPQWCHRSTRSPDEVFIFHYRKLANLVIARQRRDPGNRRFSDGGGEDFWLGRPPERHSRGAEYWLGRRS